MVVKSATKKRLIELGVSDEYAHKLATDRNMADIKSMPADEIAKILGIGKDSETFTKIMQIIADQGNRRSRIKKSKKITISSKAIDEFDRPDVSIDSTLSITNLFPIKNCSVRPTSRPKSNTTSTR